MSPASGYVCYPLSNRELKHLVPDECRAFHEALDRVVIRGVHAAGNDDREQEILHCLALGDRDDAAAAELQPFLERLQDRFHQVTGVPLELIHSSGESCMLDLPGMVWSLVPTMLTPAAQILEKRLGRSIQAADYVERD